MDLLSLLVILILVAVLLWLINTYGAPYMDAKMLKIINAVVIIAVVLWLLTVFGLLPMLRSIRVGPS